MKVITNDGKFAWQIRAEVDLRWCYHNGSRHGWTWNTHYGTLDVFSSRQVRR